VLDDSTPAAAATTTAFQALIPPSRISGRCSTSSDSELAACIRAKVSGVAPSRCGHARLDRPQLHHALSLSSPGSNGGLILEKCLVVSVRSLNVLGSRIPGADLGVGTPSRGSVDLQSGEDRLSTGFVRSSGEMILTARVPCSAGDSTCCRALQWASSRSSRESCPAFPPRASR